jgi:signal transduction histidine kinase
MVKSIVTPLDTLSYGVAQIHNGNLAFRLEYAGNDEFSPVCAAFNDMAYRLQRMEEVRQRDEESRKELIAGISHDLRTPLTSIKAYLEGIEMGVARTPAQRRKYFAEIKNKAADLEHIIERLFLFSKLELGEFPMNPEPADAGRAVTGIVNGLADEYALKGLTLAVGGMDSELWANIDIEWLRDVMINVLENSAKYKTAPDGRLSVECTRQNGDVEIRLTDDGPGVPADALPKLFDVFYRADPSRSAKGSGLGLAISALVMRRMGGGISAELPPGGGLAIRLRLPAIPGKEAAE